LSKGLITKADKLIKTKLFKNAKLESY